MSNWGLVVFNKAHNERTLLQDGNELNFEKSVTCLSLSGQVSPDRQLTGIEATLNTSYLGNLLTAQQH